MYDPHAYGPAVANLLLQLDQGQRRMPLAAGRCASPEARQTLAQTQARTLFPQARAPEAAVAGLWLYFSCLDEAHEVAQSLHTAEGSYWHGIMHRQEPDAFNAGYWFRRVGTHPVYPQLHAGSREIVAAHPQAGFRLGPQWDPHAFIELCELGRQAPGSPQEQLALDLQRLEWRLLFDYCAG